MQNGCCEGRKFALNENTASLWKAEVLLLWPFHASWTLQLPRMMSTALYMSGRWQMGIHHSHSNLLWLFEQIVLLLHLPDSCTQASLFMPLCLQSLLTVHPLVVLDCAPVSVWPTSNQRRGSCGGPERGHPDHLRLSSTEASACQSVSLSAYNTTLLLLQLATFPSESPTTACVSTRQGPAPLRSGIGRDRCQDGFQSDSSYSCTILLSFSLSCWASRGESMVEYCKHMCGACVWNGPAPVRILSACGLPKKRDFHCMRCELVWWNMV